jgi:hypothetical protein
VEFAKEKNQANFHHHFFLNEGWGNRNRYQEPPAIVGDLPR